MTRARAITKDNGDTDFTCPNCDSRVIIDASRQCWKCEAEYEVYVELEN